VKSEDFIIKSQTLSLKGKRIILYYYSLCVAIFKKQKNKTNEKNPPTHLRHGKNVLLIAVNRTP